MIWTCGETHLNQLLSDPNNFSSTLKYTHHYSPQTVDFLELNLQKLDTKTFQKTHNLHQYLHYSSNYEISRYKAITTGELVRYV